MANLSIRAFDEAQRRKKYPERRGPLGVACIQRDILIAQGNLSNLADVVWKVGLNPSYNRQINSMADDPKDMEKIHNYLSQTGLQLLQITGALGIDFLLLLKHIVEKEELTVL